MYLFFRSIITLFLTIPLLFFNQSLDIIEPLFAVVQRMTTDVLVMQDENLFGQVWKSTNHQGFFSVQLQFGLFLVIYLFIYCTTVSAITIQLFTYRTKTFFSGSQTKLIFPLVQIYLQYIVYMERSLNTCNNAKYIVIKIILEIYFHHLNNCLYFKQNQTCKIKTDYWYSSKLKALTLDAGCVSSHK